MTGGRITNGGYAGFRKLRCRFPKSGTVVLGDFNQRIPKGKFVPTRTHDALLRAFDGFQVATAGGLPHDCTKIDHIAHTPNLLRESKIEVWPKSVIIKKLNKGVDPLKLKLSEHSGVSGVWGDFSVAG